MELKIVYVAHPISGDIINNIKKVLNICKKIHSQNIIPFTPYLTALQYLNDDNVNERKLGMTYNKEFFKRKIIDEVWVYGNISEGVKQEILLANENNIKVIYKNGNT